MITEPELEARVESFDVQEEGLGSSSFGAESGEYPFYIVPAPPVPGKTGWSIASW